MPKTSKRTLRSLMRLVGKRFVFTSERYPDAILNTPEKVLRFAINHSVLHLMKSVGRIATEAENGDHGGNMDQDEIEMALAKLLVTTLNLAEKLDVSPERLHAMAVQVIEKNN